MSEFLFINTFFNMIYGNELAFVRDIKAENNYIHEFALWLEKRGINTIVLKSIFSHDVAMASNCKSISDIELMLHIPLSEEIEEIKRRFIDKDHVVYIPGLNTPSDITIPFVEHKNACFYLVDQPFSKEELSFFDPFPSFFSAMNHVDLWPGVLLFDKEKSIFISINNQKEFDELVEHLNNGDDIMSHYPHHTQDSFFVQVSDLHLGREKADKGAEYLVTSLDRLVPSMRSAYPLKFLVTGDMMESPNRKNMYKANDYMNMLKKRYKANLTFILGNHDVIVHGLNLFRNQKSKVIAYLLGENIKVLEKEKVILIKMDTTSHGNLARGMVGQRQLDEIDDELSAVENLEDYTLVVLLHHHVFSIDKAEFIKTKWHEKTFINKLLDSSKALIDAPLLIQWLKDRDIEYIFHGHKHLPYFKKDGKQYYIAAGSATGGLKESNSRYISYNVMKYDTIDKKMKNCMIIYDDKATDDRQRVEVYLF